MFQSQAYHLVKSDTQSETPGTRTGMKIPTVLVPLSGLFNLNLNLNLNRRATPNPGSGDGGGDPLLNVSTTLRIPPCQPGYAEYLDPYLASLSIELDNFPIWTGETLGEVNNFTVQLLQNLAERTGRGVWIRVGGKSKSR